MAIDGCISIFMYKYKAQLCTILIQETKPTTVLKFVKQNLMAQNYGIHCKMYHEKMASCLKIFKESFSLFLTNKDI